MQKPSAIAANVLLCNALSRASRFDISDTLVYLGRAPGLRPGPSGEAARATACSGAVEARTWDDGSGASRRALRYLLKVMEGVRE
jgi:hypothetical protein